MAKSSPAGTLRTQTGPFVMTPVWVLEHCKDARAVQLYAHLMKFANGEGRAWPTRQQLREVLDCSERSLARAVTVLKNAQALEVRLRHRADGAVVGADYVLLQVMPDRGGQNATSGIKATSPEPALMPPVPTLMPPVASVLKEELDPDNQIQEQEERTAPSARSLPLLGKVTGPELKPNDPCEAFLLAWNAAVVPPLKPVTTLTRKRKQRIRARLTEYPLEQWRDIMARIAASSFCCGAKGWIASLDWLIASPDPAVKTLEGQYDDHVTEAEIRQAKEWAFRVGRGNGCYHDPPCEDSDACWRRTALHLRRPA